MTATAVTLLPDPPSPERPQRHLRAFLFQQPLPYREVWHWQRERARLRARDEVDDVLLLLEHEPVYTIGPRGDAANVLVDAERLARLGISLERVDRGGDVTYHGPGQLVGYPIVRLAGAGRRVRAYVEALEGAVIATAARFGIVAGRLPGLTGVWVGREKLAAIGVRVTRGIAYHGFALNVGPDLTPFARIVPCGLRDTGVTSLSALLGRPVALPEVAGLVARELARTCGFTLDALVTAGPDIVKLPAEGRMPAPTVAVEQTVGLAVAALSALE